MNGLTGQHRGREWQCWFNRDWRSCGSEGIRTTNRILCDIFRYFPSGEPGKYDSEHVPKAILSTLMRVSITSWCKGQNLYFSG